MPLWRRRKLCVAIFGMLGALGPTQSAKAFFNPLVNPSTLLGTIPRGPCGMHASRGEEEVFLGV